MSAGATKVDAGHGGARGEAPAPHVSRQALALENMAAGEPDLLLNIRRAHHLRFQHRIGQVGTEAADGIESQLAHLLAMVIPGAGGKGVGNILGKDAHGVLARGNYARVMHALEINLAPEMLGEFPFTAGGEAGFPFRVGERRVDLAIVVGLRLAGTSDEVGQLAQQHIQLDGAAGNRQTLDL